MSTVSRCAIGIATLAVVLAVGGCQTSASVSTPGSTPSGSSSKLIWSDDFSGTAGALPSSSKWSFETGANGWGNQELECYTDASGNAQTDGDGHLVISAIRQPGHRCSDGGITDYTSARITTEHKFTAKYGRLEVRAKVPTSSGTWPAFWALGSNIDSVNWPEAGEIDVMEIVGNHPTVIHGTLHGPKAGGASFSVGTSWDTGHDLGDAYHVYAADWTPTSITFSVDGHTYGGVTQAQVQRAGGTWVFNHEFYLLLNLAVGGNYPGNPDGSATWPQRYVIDYVRVYS
jgi:beta-glucanase (GH16 family)